MLLHALLYLIGKLSSRVAGYAHTFKKKIYWNLAIRICIEGYLDFAISGTLNAQKLFWNNFSDYYSSILACISLGVFYGFPLIVAFFLYW